MLEDPGEGSVEERRMAEAGLEKKVKRRKRRRMIQIHPSIMTIRVIRLISR